MKTIVSPKGMRTCEEQYFKETGTKSIDLMERAAQAAADVIAAEMPAGSRLYFACGTGGNGGDGLACARLLSDRYDCTIILPKEPKTPDAIENLRRAEECGIPVLKKVPRELPDAWVDAVFGIGLSRPIEVRHVLDSDPNKGLEYDLLSNIHLDHAQRGVRVYAIDIPSGLDGRTGHAYPGCVHADRTITFQYLKWGHKLNDGLDYCGEITVADIGLGDTSIDSCDFESHAHLALPDEIHHIHPRRRNIHKNTCGHLLVVAGSFGMAGAAIMCAEAALRSGVGLLTIACPRSIVPILQTVVPQAMCIPLEEQYGAIAPEALPQIQSALAGKDAVVIGPGLTRKVSPEIIRAVLEANLPTVIDADALNILSENRELLSLLTTYHVITPHPGEAVRLIPGLDVSDPIAASLKLRELGAIALLKGASSVIADDLGTVISASGCQGMARGGSGDILSGIMGALMAERVIQDKPALSDMFAWQASEIHGRAGELAQAKYGVYGMNVRDIIEFIPEVMK